MGLRETIENDLSVTLEADFGWPVFLREPAGEWIEIKGQVHPTDAQVDPMTNQMVYLRRTAIALRISTVNEKGIQLNEGVTEVKTTDVNGTAIEGTIAKGTVARDAAIGFVTFTVDRKMEFTDPGVQ